MKSHDTLTDEFLQVMPFKMESSCPLNFDDQLIRSHQTSDPDLQFHFMLHKQIIPSLPFHCQMKLSTHIFNDLICTFLSNGRRVIMAQKKLQSILIYLAHNNSGHLSSKYTYVRPSHNWYWANMHSDIDFFLQILSWLCKNQNPLAIYPSAVDAATGFVFAKACKPKTSSKVIALLLNTIIPYFGCPKAIVTNLGVENENQKVSQLLDYVHIKQITSSRAHPNQMEL